MVDSCTKFKYDLTEERWSAIKGNDSSYDGAFYYAVKTTGIFCRPSCNSKTPKKTNVIIFKNHFEALNKNFRPCKRCKPTELLPPNKEWVFQIKKYMDLYYDHELTLEILAETFHGSPFHLQRMFKRVTGSSPIEYLQSIRMERAKQLLIETKLSIIAVSDKIGIPNSSYFATVFKKNTGCTPSEYRRMHVKVHE